jgi:hypothetical protein
MYDVLQGSLLATLDELLTLGRLFVVVSGRVMVRIVHDEEDWEVLTLLALLVQKYKY